MQYKVRANKASSACDEDRVPYGGHFSRDPSLDEIKSHASSTIALIQAIANVCGSAETSFAPVENLLCKTNMAYVPTQDGVLSHNLTKSHEYRF
jgi:hypothetical protein